MARHMADVVQEGMPLCITGRLSVTRPPPNASRMGLEGYGLTMPLKVVVEEFWLVQPDTIPPDSWAAGGCKVCTPILCAWCNGVLAHHDGIALPPTPLGYPCHSDISTCVCDCSSSCQHDATVPATRVFILPQSEHVT